jgi:hypothetical protein
MEGADITTASKDDVKDTAVAGVAMVRNYLESLPMAPVQESLGPCHPMKLQLDGESTTARSNDSSATLMAFQSTPVATTTATTTTGKPPATKLLPSTITTSTSNDTFFAIGSGRYADFVFRYAAREIYDVDVDVVPRKPITGVQVVTSGSSGGGNGAGARSPQQSNGGVLVSQLRRSVLAISTKPLCTARATEAISRLTKQL